MYKILNNTEIVTISDIGYMIAPEGIIVLNGFNPSAIEGTSITITAQPNSWDIAPRRNQLVSIRMENVQVTPQIDTIATGGTSAGIGYETTPRHPGNS